MTTIREIKNLERRSMATNDPEERKRLRGEIYRISGEQQERAEAINARDAANAGAKQAFTNPVPYRAESERQQNKIRRAGTSGDRKVRRAAERAARRAKRRAALEG